MSEYLTTLTCLREVRRTADLNLRQIEAISVAGNIRDRRNAVLTVDRLRQLENLPRHEPTYAEARTLARMFLLPGIGPLITTGTIHSMTNVFGMSEPTDRAFFLMHDAVPLSIACRLAISLGLDDPMELEATPLTIQLWDTMSRNERLAGPGECPWCRGVSGIHLESCLPDTMWAPRNTEAYITSTFPKPAKPRTRGDSHMAFGLKVIRAAKCITQKQLAQDLGLHPNYISRIECMESPLTQGNAEKIAVKLGVPVERLFMRPADSVPVPMEPVPEDAA